MTPTLGELARGRTFPSFGTYIPLPPRRTDMDEEPSMETSTEPDVPRSPGDDEDFHGTYSEIQGCDFPQTTDDEPDAIKRASICQFLKVEVEAVMELSPIDVICSCQPPYKYHLYPHPKEHLHRHAFYLDGANSPCNCHEQEINIQSIVAEKRSELRELKKKLNSNGIFCVFHHKPLDIDSESAEWPGFLLSQIAHQLQKEILESIPPTDKARNQTVVNYQIDNHFDPDVPYLNLHEYYVDWDMTSPSLLIHNESSSLGTTTTDTAQVQHGHEAKLWTKPYLDRLHEATSQIYPTFARPNRPIVQIWKGPSRMWRRVNLISANEAAEGHRQVMLDFFRLQYEGTDGDESKQGMVSLMDKSVGYLGLNHIFFYNDFEAMRDGDGARRRCKTKAPTRDDNSWPKHSWFTSSIHPLRPNEPKEEEEEKKKKGKRKRPTSETNSLPVWITRFEYLPFKLVDLRFPYYVTSDGGDSKEAEGVDDYKYRIRREFLDRCGFSFRDWFLPSDTSFNKTTDKTFDFEKPSDFMHVHASRKMLGILLSKIFPSASGVIIGPHQDLVLFQPDDFLMPRRLPEIKSLVTDWDSICSSIISHARSVFQNERAQAKEKTSDGSGVKLADLIPRNHLQFMWLSDQVSISTSRLFDLVIRDPKCCAYGIVLDTMHILHSAWLP